MTSKKDKERLRAYRKENFLVDVQAMKNQYLYEDEMEIRITKNGNQVEAISLTPSEAEVLIAKLRPFTQPEVKASKTVLSENETTGATASVSRLFDWRGRTNEKFTCSVGLEDGNKDIMNIHISNNGYQGQCLSTTPEGAVKVMNALKRFFS